VIRLLAAAAALVLAALPLAASAQSSDPGITWILETS
jgi:hypothetical protein